MDYAICKTQYWYGPRKTKTRVTDEYGHDWTGTHAEARKMIKTLYNAVYYTAHNESGRASYTIVKA